MSFHVPVLSTSACLLKQHDICQLERRINNYSFILQSNLTLTGSYLVLFSVNLSFSQTNMEKFQSVEDMFPTFVITCFLVISCSYFLIYNVSNVHIPQCHAHTIIPYYYKTSAQIFHLSLLLFSFFPHSFKINVG